MPSDDHYWITTDEMEAFADLLPCQAQTDDEKIATLLDLLAGRFENDADLDFVRDAALQHLLRFPRLPERTIDIMRSILADVDDSDLVLNRKAAAIEVLAYMWKKNQVQPRQGGHLSQ